MKYTQIYCDICNDVIFSNSRWTPKASKVYKYSLLHEVSPKEFPSISLVEDLCENCFTKIYKSKDLLRSIKEIKRMAKFKNETSGKTLKEI